MMIKPYIGPAYNNSVMKITQALLDDFDGAGMQNSLYARMKEILQLMCGSFGYT